MNGIAGASAAGGKDHAGPLASVLQNLAGLAGAVRDASPDTAAVLAVLSGARGLAAELERGELALIEAARDSGATWSQIAEAMGGSRRQTAQKRHADLSRRYPRPPMVDTSAPETASAAADSVPDGVAAPAGSVVPAPRLAPARPAATARRRRAAPKITPAVIGEGRYQIVKAADHAESRAWDVLVGGKRAGLVRPTWRGERGRPGWQPVTNDGTPLSVTGTSRVTPAGNARTRDAAAVSLLHALHRQQDGENRHKGPL